MSPADQKVEVDRFRSKLKSTRANLALLTTVLGVDSKEMTLGTFIDVLERVYYNPFLLKQLLEENS